MKDEEEILAAGAGLVACYFAVHAIWNLIVILFYLVLLWLPPLLFSAFLACLPPVVTWFVCRLYKRHGSKMLSSKSDNIVAVWQKSWLQLLPLAGIIIILGLWTLIVPRSTPWPTNHGIMTHVLAWGQNDVSAQQLYVTREPVTFLFLVVPLVVGYFLPACLLQANVVRRFTRIDACLRGNDLHTTYLGSMDRQLDAAYGALGARRTESYVENFRAWVTASLTTIVQYNAQQGTRARKLKEQATNELAVVRHRVQKFQTVESLYRQGIRLLQTRSSVTLLESLEDTQRALTSPAFVQLLETRQWSQVDAFLQAAHERLEGIMALAEKWHEAEAHARSAAPAGAMTLEEALGLFGLSRNYTDDEVSTQHKRLARIYHPDSRPDDEGKRRNEEMLKRINTAEEMLSKKLEEQ